MTSFEKVFLCLTPLLITSWFVATGSASAQVASSSLCDPHRLGVILGTEDDDSLIGTEGDDVIVALGGHDKIDGKGGDDIICAGEGNDVVDGGDGNDVIDAGAGDDKVSGRAGHDLIVGGEDDDDLNGGDGNDRIEAGPGHDKVSAGKGDDDILGGDGNDSLTVDVKRFTFSEGIVSEATASGSLDGYTATDALPGERNYFAIGSADVPPAEVVSCGAVTLQ